MGFASYQSKVEVAGPKLRYWGETLEYDLSVTPTRFADLRQFEGRIVARKTPLSCSSGPSSLATSTAISWYAGGPPSSIPQVRTFRCTHDGPGQEAYLINSRFKNLSLFVIYFRVGPIPSPPPSGPAITPEDQATLARPATRRAGHHPLPRGKYCRYQELSHRHL